MTKEEALKLIDAKWWVGKTYREIAEFQMAEERLCCPFDIFHEAVEKTLNRPVWTHEFGLDWEGLKKELYGERKPPCLLDILKLLPSEKTVVVTT